MTVSVARHPAAVSAPRLLDITTERDRRASGISSSHAHPDASGYHLSGWRRVFESAFGHETVYLAAREHGRIVGVLPLVVFRSRVFGRFAVSLPFVNYGGVLRRGRRGRAGAGGEGRRRSPRRGRLSHVELRHTARQLPDLPARTHKVGMRLALGADAARAWDGLDRKVRNQVRKAEKSGLTWRRGGAELLDRFYAVFARNMRDLGTPVYSRRFFEQVLSTFPATVARVPRRPRRPHGRRRDRAVAPRRPRSALGVVAARVPQPVPEQSAVLAHHRARHRKRPTRRSTSADRRRTRARISSRSSGAPGRSRCSGNT